jgi:hypothetical protein
LEKAPIVITERNVIGGPALERYIELPDGSRAYLAIDGKPVVSWMKNKK